MDREQGFANVITSSRFAPDRLLAFDRLPNLDKETMLNLQDKLISSLSNKDLEVGSLEYPNAPIPQDILHNNSKVRGFVTQSAIALREKIKNNEAGPEEVREYLSTNHENIKWSLNQWLLINPGQSREISTIDSGIHERVRKWLHDQFQVEEGDVVLNRHVISNSGRNRLQNMGFNVPYQGLHEAYYRDGMQRSSEMLRKWTKYKGVISEGSWLYSPENFLLAPDGQPFVRFTFLANNDLVGERFFIAIATENKYPTQYSFATRSKRRAEYAKLGIFQPKVYAAFYPREKLINHGNFTKD